MFYDKKRHKEFSEQLGGFCFISTTNESLFSLDVATLSRLTYLATYMNYDNKLMFGNNFPILKKHLPKVLNVSTNTASCLFNTCKDCGLLIDEKKNGIYLSDWCHKGKIKTSSRVKIYKNTFRAIYEYVPISKQKYIGHVLKLIPYLNQEWNVPCENISKTDFSQIHPYDTKQMRQIMECSDGNTASRVRKTLSSIIIDVGGVKQYAFVFQSVKTSTGRITTLFVNPNAIYSGTHLENIDFVLEKFIMKES